MTEKPQPPDWESFETYKGDPESSAPPSLGEWIFHYCMVLLGLAVIFCICGALAFLLFCRGVALSETAFSAWLRFIIGGVIGDTMILYWYFKGRG